VVADYLSRTPNAPVETIPINENFPDEHILVMCKESWYADIANYLATGQTPSSWSRHDKHHFFTQIWFFFWDKPYLFKYCPDQIIRRCLSENEYHSVLIFYHEFACGGHFGPRKTAEKVLQSGFYWPTLFKDSYNFCKLCARCQMIGQITRKDMMPLTPVLEVKIFYVWGINFMGPFPTYFGNQFILIAVDYISKWVKLCQWGRMTIELSSSFWEKISFRASEPLCDNKQQRESFLQSDFWSPNAEVLHFSQIIHNLQISDERAGEVTNRQIKLILKKIIGKNRKD